MRKASVRCKLTFDLLTLKVVHLESHVTLATSVPILVSLGLSVRDLGPTYVTDRRQTLSDVRLASSLNASALSGGGCITIESPKKADKSEL